jgi:predicted CXXCH cytochrome family protein
MVVGSGQHTNSHIMFRNGKMCQMPMTFYTQDGRWDLPPGFENANNSRFSRPIEAECINCHNAHPTPNPGGANHYLSVPQGIDCERCHGPGALHVREKMAGWIVDTSRGPDYSIVNPGRLTHSLQNDLCKRCHLQGNAVLKEGRSFSDFKPGMVLSDVFSVFLPRHKNHEDYFIMASHPDRLAQSPCLKQQPLAMRCISCHNPHRSVQKTSSLQYNKECFSCHGGSASGESDCTAPASSRLVRLNNCVLCHMPKSGSSDIPHVRITDHKIQIPKGNGGFQNLPPQGALLGLASLNEDKPEPLTMARAWLQYVERFEGEKEGLDSAQTWLDKVPQVGRNTAWLDAKVHHVYLKQSPKELEVLMKANARTITPQNSTAWMAYRIAQLLSLRKMHAEATPYFAQAVRLLPLSSDFQLNLALNEFQLARRLNAVQRLEKLIEQDPSYVPAYANLGYMHLLDGNARQAGICYEKALDLDPDHPQTLLNAVGLQLHLKRPQEAKRLITRILKRYPQDVRALALRDQMAATP